MDTVISLSIGSIVISTILQSIKIIRWSALVRRLVATGVLLLPIILIVADVIPFRNTGFHLINPILSILYAIPASLITILIISHVVHSRGHELTRELMNTQEELLISCVVWIFYIIAYELVFRGLLFYSCLNIMPAGLAIAINIVIYSLVHLPISKSEAALSIPFGLFLCLITHHTGNVWSAVIIHLSLALSYSVFSYGRQSSISQDSVQQ